MASLSVDDLNTNLALLTKKSSVLKKAMTLPMGILVVQVVTDATKMRLLADKAIKRIAAFSIAVSSPTVEQLVSKVVALDVTGARLKQTLVPLRELQIDFRKIIAVVPESTLETYKDWMSAKRRVEEIQSQVSKALHSKWISGFLSAIAGLRGTSDSDVVVANMNDIVGKLMLFSKVNGEIVVSGLFAPGADEKAFREKQPVGSALSGVWGLYLKM